jgi:cell volume regulation protein A
VIIVVALTQVAKGGKSHGLGFLLAEAGYELAVGAAVGLLIGWLGAIGLRRVALPASGLYPIAVLGLAVGAYGTAATLHASGFLAVYLASLLLGNSRLPHGVAVRGFAEGLGWVAQIGLFVLLGLLAAPSRLLGQVGPALAIGLVLLLLARPLSVLASVSWFGLPLREQLFLSWAGLRGAVPVVLATVPMAAGVQQAERLFDLVFVLVVIFTLVQAPTLPRMARWLGLTGSVQTVGLDVESSPLGAQGADVLEAHVGPSSRLHGVEIFELRLPEGANVTLVLRGQEAFVPTPQTMLRHGDDVIVVTSDRVRDEVEERLRAVSAGGKLSGWLSDGAGARVRAGPTASSGWAVRAEPRRIRRLRPTGRRPIRAAERDRN